jgi:hypothetical protein
MQRIYVLTVFTDTDRLTAAVRRAPDPTVAAVMVGGGDLVLVVRGRG